MHDNRRLIVLTLLMIVVSLSVGGTAISLLYQTAFEQEKVRLIETARSQARLMEAVALFDAQYSQTDIPGGAVAATLSQIEDAHARGQGFGDTGTFVIGRKEGDQIAFLDAYQQGKQITIPPVPLKGKLAIPMQRALAGYSGAMIGLDFRNKMVLAAYEPVSILNIGIVVKIDLAEIRKPFIKTSMIVLTIAFVIIVVGSTLFFRIGNPILEQIKAQNKTLKEAQNRLSKAQKIARLGNWSWNIGTNAILWSDEVYRIFGLNPKQFTPTYDNFLKTVHPDDQEKVETAIATALTTLHSYELEHRIIKSDGTERIVHELGEVQIGIDGMPQTMIGTVQDITARKTIETQQTKTKEQLEEALLFNTNILEQSPVGIAIYDQSGQCILANLAIAKTVGATKEEVLKQNFNHIASWRKTDLYDKALLAINNHRPERTTISTVSTFGKPINLACHLAPFISKEHVLLLLMVDDITHKITTEKARKESEATVRLLLDSTAEAIYGMGLDGRCTFANPACIKMLGYDDINELLGQNMHGLIHYAYPDGSPYPQANCHIYQAFEKQQGTHIDDEVLWRKDGTSFPAEYWSYPMQQEEETVGLVVTFLDITERKEFEQALKESKEAADAANLAKSQFLTSISHEIRTPMNAIIGVADHLKNTKLSEQNRQLVSVLNKSANGLLELINDVLDLSKIEAGQMVTNEVDFNLSVLIYEVISIMEVTANKKGIKLKKEIDPLIPEQVQCDLKCIRQVLINLIGNAIKFTKKGEISITVKPYNQVDSSHSKAMPYPKNKECSICFTIKDTGIGIAADRLDDIFNRFTQADGSITRSYGGTGLGLTISKKMVELMGGKIWVESELDKGSTFYFTVHCKPATKHLADVNEAKDKKIAATINPVDNHLSRPLNILIVDDSEDNILLMRLYLKTTQHQTDFVENGELAVQRFKKKNYDIVLMDMQMPVKNGYDATREIREWEKQEGKKITPIIAVTANALRSEEQKCFDAGCSGYLSKPFKRDQLIETIDTHSQG